MMHPLISNASVVATHQELLIIDRGEVLEVLVSDNNYWVPLVKVEMNHEHSPKPDTVIEYAVMKWVKMVSDKLDLPGFDIPIVTPEVGRKILMVLLYHQGSAIPKAFYPPQRSLKSCKKLALDLLARDDMAVMAEVASDDNTVYGRYYQSDARPYYVDWTENRQKQSRRFVNRKEAWGYYSDCLLVHLDVSTNATPVKRSIVQANR